MNSRNSQRIEDLPIDNAARIAIYDALAADLKEQVVVNSERLFEQVIGRLRVLVPRELHLTGERPYVDDKVQACIDAGLIVKQRIDGRAVFGLTGQPPQVRYPDGVLRDYPVGLEAARERLDRDNARLRDARFDVRTLVPSIADDPDGLGFLALLASMREHGFLKQFPIVKFEDDVVVDGRARLRAAAILHVDVDYLKYASDKERKAARRRDTPLNRILIAVQSNAGRLSSDVLDDVHGQVARITRRPWDDTEADLALTSDWRRAVPPDYSPAFQVSRLAFRDAEEPKIQVTADGKVMLRSLIEAAGLSNYKTELLRDYVPFELARSVHSAGRKAIFARADDLITGIAAMQDDRRSTKLKLDPEWEQIRAWLVANFPGTTPGPDDRLPIG
jgi:hypothetical protein